MEHFLDIDPLVPCRMCDATGLSREPKDLEKVKRPECRFCKGSGRVVNLLLEEKK